MQVSTKSLQHALANNFAPLRPPGKHRYSRAKAIAFPSITALMPTLAGGGSTGTFHSYCERVQEETPASAIARQIISLLMAPL